MATSSKPIDRSGSTNGDSSAERGAGLPLFSLEIRAAREGQTVLPDALFDEEFLRSCRFRRQTHNSFGREPVDAPCQFDFEIPHIHGGEKPSTSTQSRPTSNVGETVDR